jgi:hypothetical protein
MRELVWFVIGLIIGLNIQYWIYRAIDGLHGHFHMTDEDETVFGPLDEEYKPTAEAEDSGSDGVKKGYDQGHK